MEYLALAHLQCLMVSEQEQVAVLVSTTVAHFASMVECPGFADHLCQELGLDKGQLEVDLAHQLMPFHPFPKVFALVALA